MTTSVPLPATKQYPRRWGIQSLSNPATQYVVAINTKGDFSCSCAQWKFRHQTCKHIVLIQQVREPQPRPAPPLKQAILWCPRCGKKEYFQPTAQPFQPAAPNLLACVVCGYSFPADISDKLKQDGPPTLARRPLSSRTFAARPRRAIRLEDS